MSEYHIVPYKIIWNNIKIWWFDQILKKSSQEMTTFENNNQTLTVIMIMMIKTYNNDNDNNNNNNNRMKWFHSLLSLTWSSNAIFKQGSMIKTWLAWVRLIPTAPALIDRRNTVVGGSFYSGLKNVQRERLKKRECTC